MPNQEITPKDEKIITPSANQVEVKKKKLPLLKIFAVMFFIILLLGSIGGTVFLFLSSEKFEKEKNECADKLQQLESDCQDKSECCNDLQQLESEVEDNQADSEENDPECPECICNCPDCVCNEGEGPCNKSYTEDEEAMMTGWIEYTNDTYHYSFMHPADWMMVTSDSKASLEAGKSMHFEFFVVSGDVLNESIIPDVPFTVENGKTRVVSCFKAFEFRVSQTDWLGAVTYVVADGTAYVIWVRFTDEGASVTSDTIELYDLILKTFEFE